jgi:hypothetical protein
MQADTAVLSIYGHRIGRMEGGFTAEDMSKFATTLPPLLRSGEQFKTLFGVYRGIPKT